MKRLIVCCDGTWQKLTNPYPTNVVKIAQSVKAISSDGIAQIVYYDEGVGTSSRLDALFGGAFGRGIDKNIEDAYRFLCLNYVAGDEIYLFGFSRGAYTVRSLAGMIYNCGLLGRHYIRQAPIAYTLYRARGCKPNESQAIAFRKMYGERVPITLLGCWDTVGSLGIPEVSPWMKFNRKINEKYRFHDTKLNRTIQHALHAVAIDETRKIFDVTPMEKSQHAENQVLKQVWFPGDHSCIGGGFKNRRYLSDAPLKWMMDSIPELGLDLDLDESVIEDGLKIDPACELNLKPHNLISKFTILGGVVLRDVSDRFEDIHDVTRQRFLKRKDYKPKNLLRKHRSRLKQ
ncbi:DUF2235 domain-containing protein [Oscillatoriales cyanobacterium LEGE 11467]|uniref:DUF2235 domain-containing protein n=1 Tax=Zarconia navalis LEGE 11467 TaxID=1828826 RepID=A0A928VX11_9CYAN|nr:DUF2235 domain-containing protein [Zarconia navalis]MBE9040307.1 DUF2235 domain-containing protein [Zarconia navalis LEGE 11467]